MDMRRLSPDAKQLAQVAICASDGALRQRVEATLEAGGHQVVGAAEFVHELIDGWSILNARLIVLACQLEPFAPVQDITIVRSRLPEAPIVIVATGLLTSAARRVVRADVQGLVHETSLEAALVPTVDSVLADQLCVPAGLREALAAPVFSHREKQVLELVLAGLTNSEIAGRLYLSESTVKSHLASSFRKLGVSSRAEAASRLLRSDSEIDPPISWTTHAPALTTTPELT